MNGDGKMRLLGGVVIVLILIAAVWAGWGVLFGDPSSTVVPSPSEDGRAQVGGEDAAFARDLLRRGAVVPLDEVKKTLRDPSPTVRSAAVTLLGYHLSKVEPRLLRRLATEDESDRVRAKAVSLLVRQDRWENLPAIVDALEDPSVRVRRRAIDGVEDMLGLRPPYDPEAPEARRDADAAAIRRLYPSLERHWRAFKARREK